MGYRRLDGKYADQAGGLQITLWFCDDEASRAQLESEQELKFGDLILVAAPKGKYMVNTKGMVVSV